INKMEEIHKQSDRFNIDAESLQKIAVPAEHVGIGIEQVARAMNAATIAGVKAADGNKTLAAAFNQLNINALQFNALAPDQKILAVAEAYERSAKTADDYNAVAAILTKRNTEIIGAFQDIIKFSGETASSLQVFSNSQVEAAHQAHLLFEELK